MDVSVSNNFFLSLRGDRKSTPHKSIKSRRLSTARAADQPSNPNSAVRGSGRKSLATLNANVCSPRTGSGSKLIQVRAPASSGQPASADQTRRQLAFGDEQTGRGKANTVASKVQRTPPPQAPLSSPGQVQELSPEQVQNAGPAVTGKLSTPELIRRAMEATDSLHRRTGKKSKSTTPVAAPIPSGAESMISPKTPYQNDELDEDVTERDVMERLAFSTYDEEESGARSAMQWPSPTGFNMMQRQEAAFGRIKARQMQLEAVASSLSHQLAADIVESKSTPKQQQTPDRVAKCGRLLSPSGGPSTESQSETSPHGTPRTVARLGRLCAQVEQLSTQNEQLSKHSTHCTTLNLASQLELRKIETEFVSLMALVGGVDGAVVDTFKKARSNPRRTALNTGPPRSPLNMQVEQIPTNEPTNAPASTRESSPPQMTQMTHNNNSSLSSMASAAEKSDSTSAATVVIPKHSERRRLLEIAAEQGRFSSTKVDQQSQPDANAEVDLSLFSAFFDSNQKLQPNEGAAIVNRSCQCALM